MLLKIARASLWNRKLTAFLTAFSIAVSVFILLGVDHLKNELEASFGRTVSGVDVIVGPRTGPVNLLLYSVFRIGNPTNNISWQTVETLKDSPQVDWMVPISLGDSHKGYAVMGTSEAYFERFKYGDKQPLAFAQGRAFASEQEVVLGAAVAEKLGYKLNESITLSHGTGEVSFTQHKGHPLKIVGILSPTGTPVDQTVHVDLGAIAAIHDTSSRPKIGQRIGAKPKPADHHEHDEHKHDSHDHHDDHDAEPKHQEHSEHAHQHHQPDSVTALLVGLKTRIGVLQFQRQVNQFKDEALLGIIPGVALSQLWEMMGMVQGALSLVAALVLVASLLGMMTMLLASLREREREIAVLRAIGAPSRVVLLLIEIEAVLITLVGAVMGYAILAGSLTLARPLLSQQFGLFIGPLPMTASTGIYLLVVLALAALLALLPAWLSYRTALSRGLSARV
ncbi:putative ABC transporter permease [Saliniradius amylolyticus]|uniref:Putative ABC transporter permease n=1 Tax=Saliniradius amylolyticus TaxID=2183582 RepID=A0A2S2E1R4_9ALTE|nr:FtsX-like permease family protein [Saliniradius amylolyticus]AWL11576.1 putative ABC transporter permease [Saliniradius amylolyticus]